MHKVNLMINIDHEYPTDKLNKFIKDLSDKNELLNLKLISTAEGRNIDIQLNVDKLKNIFVKEFKNNNLEIKDLSESSIRELLSRKLTEARRFAVYQVDDNWNGTYSDLTADGDLVAEFLSLNDLEDFLLDVNEGNTDVDPEEGALVAVDNTKKKISSADVNLGFNWVNKL